MTPTRKVTSSTRRSTLHSRKEGLSTPAKKSYQKLGGKLEHYQTRRKGMLELAVIEERVTMSQ